MHLHTATGSTSYHTHEVLVWSTLSPVIGKLNFELVSINGLIRLGVSYFCRLIECSHFRFQEGLFFTFCCQLPYLSTSLPLLFCFH